MKIVSLSQKGIVDHFSHIYSHFKQLLTDDQQYGTSDTYNRFGHTTSLYSIREWYMRLADDTRYNHSIHLVFDEENNPVGLGQVSHDKKTNTSELSISVNRDSRGKEKGVSKALVESMIKSFKESSSTLLTLSCEVSNRRCYRFFESLGFSMRHSSEEMCFIGEMTND